MTTTRKYSVWDDVAKVLVDYATAVAPGEKVLIIMREPDIFPAVRAVHRRAVEAGGHVQTLFYSMYLQRDLLQFGSEDQIAWVPEVWKEAMHWADVCIDLRGARNLNEFNGVPSGGVTALRKAEGVISSLRTTETRWTLLRIPNEAFAQQAGMSTDEMEEFFFRAVLQDWESESASYHRMRDRLQGTGEVRITGRETDLRFSTAGRSYVVDDGHINMPGGEIFTSPVEETVEGTVSFENPGVFAGTLMEGIRLTFRDGLVVDASARTNEAFLIELLDMDAGSRRIGEFGIGTNRQITTFCNDILFDEKILGTVHFALGRSYTECGGVNSSALHWDIVKDLREEGEITMDGTTVFRNGAWEV
jgi:aminopeptidase